MTILIQFKTITLWHGSSWGRRCRILSDMECTYGYI